MCAIDFPASVHEHMEEVARRLNLTRLSDVTRVSVGLGSVLNEHVITHLNLKFTMMIRTFILCYMLTLSVYK